MEVNNNCIKLKSVPAMYEHESTGKKPKIIESNPCLLDPAVPVLIAVLTKSSLDRRPVPAGSSTARLKGAALRRAFSAMSKEAMKRFIMIDYDSRLPFTSPQPSPSGHGTAAGV